MPKSKTNDSIDIGAIDIFDLRDAEIMELEEHFGLDAMAVGQAARQSSQRWVLGADGNPMLGHDGNPIPNPPLLCPAGRLITWTRYMQFVAWLFARRQDPRLELGELELKPYALVQSEDNPEEAADPLDVPDSSGKSK